MFDKVIIEITPKAMETRLYDNNRLAGTIATTLDVWGYSVADHKWQEVLDGLFGNESVKDACDDLIHCLNEDCTTGILETLGKLNILYGGDKE